MHKRYAQSLAEYSTRKQREKVLREKFGHDSTKVLQGDLPIPAPTIGPEAAPIEVRECKTFIIHGFNEALERYREEQKRKKEKIDAPRSKR